MPPRKPKVNVETSPENHPPPSTRLEAGTPEHEPTKQAAANGITQAQKQALIDNLQQEITDRARKLRGQYALQAQGLRVRLEGRLNRVPFQLRQRKMQDLMNEYVEKRSPAKPALMSTQARKVVEVPMPRKELKRQSDQISTASDDKENDTDHDLANPKKRAKPTATNPKAAATTAPSNAARKAILSPRSHNSRTLPRSPFKTSEPNKSTTQLPIPSSPAKPTLSSSTAPQPKATSTRPAPRPQQQRNITRSDTDGGRSSGASNTSASTTIVSKKKSTAASARGKAGAATKKAIASATSAMKSAATGRKAGAAGAKKENVVPAAGGRSLRKRT
ncbi:Borealin N terminal-domain-containing protein [Neohortaea acidophila]|uniref:Borealin N terminal-domain-containing protein n=1 Tax=Neohortaea acidophila TaxID=245834 RepID=A0A6A6PLA3_9PEZI|nr:Borealin N terminal-domain-containing protein [Neohortaea acidophila]KAF2480471.1 Borealin N terminal-domain-containing protein [Neohortaea acidophila]